MNDGQNERGRPEAQNQMAIIPVDDDVGDDEDGNMMSDDTTASSSSSSNDDEPAFPLPRDHSYLSGASHPLLVEQDPSKLHEEPTTRMMNGASTGPAATIELAILELQLVLFPGSTIPVKLRDRSLISYLGHQIEVCRNVPHRQPEVRLGILTHESYISIYARRRRRERRAVTNRSRRRNNENSNGAGADDSDGDDADEDEDVDYARMVHEHPYIGRIGTIATIQYTQELTTEGLQQVENSSSSSSSNRPSSHVWRRYQEMTELVFTAVGTSRFEVVAPIPSDSSAASSIYQVREIRDVPLLRPPFLNHRKLFSSRPTGGSGDVTGFADEDETDKNKNWRVRRHDQVTWNLSIMTPIPHFVYDRNFPWKIVDELVALLQQNRGRSNLPHLGTRHPISRTRRKETKVDIAGSDDDNENDDDWSTSCSPTQFSFWLAGNMPFTQSERLLLLQMSSTLERLRMLRAKVLELVNVEEVRYLGCARCEMKLAPVGQVFSFHGAEGATSNYVNDHGYIHQITTLRGVVEERRLYYQGPPSTENSYFPGYSWTIAYCRRCASLLGWKFQRVSRPVTTSTTTTTTSNSSTKKNCPDTFFGFQSSSLTTLQDE